MGVKSGRQSKKNNKKKMPFSVFINQRVDNLAQTFAWVGTFSILTSYFLSTIGLIPQNDPVLHGLNLLGAIGLISIALPKRIYQAVFLNSVWAITAIVGLIKFLTR